MDASGAFDLQRFVDAQANSFETALAELQAGRKRTHWMWFIFPQLRGLGSSSMAHLYGIESLPEAHAYLSHQVLGPRLILCTEAVLAHRDRELREVLGSPDDLKFCSSMTLFAQVADRDQDVFARAITVHCQGRQDARTLHLLRREG